MPTSAQIDNIVTLLEETAAETGISDAFFVGGFPRSIAMGLSLDDVHDLDIATGTYGKAAQLAGLFAAKSHPTRYQMRHRTRTINMEVGGVELDFQGPMNYEDARHWLHAWEIEATPIALNVFQRDFTMNSLVLPFGGNELKDITRRAMPDIHDRRVASILPPDEAVAKNPIMITRAVRLAAKYNFRIESKLWHAMLTNSGTFLDEVSPERQAIEAFALSKYYTGDLLKSLGLRALIDPMAILEGKQLSQAE